MLISSSDLQLSGDADLIAACLEGDQAAWDQLVSRYSRLVFSIALKSGLSDTDANDVLQNVFITAVRRLESLRDRERFSSWLITTTKRESWRYKKAHCEVSIDEDEVIVDSEPGIEAEVIAWEEASITHRGLQRLGDRCHRLITMIFLTDDRPSYEEISESLGIAVGSIGPIRARCLKQLRGHLEELGLEPR